MAHNSDRYIIYDGTERADQLVSQVNPQVGAGVSAPVGSILQSDFGGTDTDGRLYLKFGPNDTDWREIVPGTDVQTATFVVGNQDAGDTIDQCDFLFGTVAPATVTALHDAVTAVSALPDGGAIHIKRGTYDLNLSGLGSLVIPQNVRVWGDGASTELQGIGGVPVFDIDGPAATIFGVQIAHMTIQGDGAACVTVTDYGEIELSNILFRMINAFGGVFMVDCTATTGIAGFGGLVIRDSAFFGNSGGGLRVNDAAPLYPTPVMERVTSATISPVVEIGGPGIFGSDPMHVILRECVIATTTGDGIQVQNGSAGRVTANDCFFQVDTGYCVNIEGLLQDSHFESCTFTSPNEMVRNPNNPMVRNAFVNCVFGTQAFPLSNTAFDIQNGAQGGSIRGCSFVTAGFGGGNYIIDTAFANENFTIEGCAIPVSDRMVRVQNAQGVSILNNQFAECQSNHALEIFGERINVIGNEFVGNTGNNGRAILSSGRNINISDNRFLGFQQQEVIDFRNATMEGVTIARNHFYDMQQPSVIAMTSLAGPPFPRNVSIIDNVFQWDDTPSYAGPVMQIDPLSGLVIRGNLFQDIDDSAMFIGVDPVYTGPLIADNVFAAQSMNAPFITLFGGAGGCKGTRIVNNEFTTFGATNVPAIELQGDWEDALIDGNVFSEMGDGAQIINLAVGFCSGIRFVNNLVRMEFGTISRLFSSGVALDYFIVADNILRGALIANEYNFSRIAGNRFLGALLPGITLTNGDRNVISENFLQNGGTPEIVLQAGTTNNRVLYNRVPTGLSDLGTGNVLSGNFA